MRPNKLTDEQAIVNLKNDYYVNFLTYAEIRQKYNISNKMIREICQDKRKKPRPDRGVQRGHNIRTERHKQLRQAKRDAKNKEIFTNVCNHGFTKTLIQFNLRPKMLARIMMDHDITTVTLESQELDLQQFFKKRARSVSPSGRRGRWRRHCNTEINALQNVNDYDITDSNNFGHQ